MRVRLLGAALVLLLLVGFVVAARAGGEEDAGRGDAAAEDADLDEVVEDVKAFVAEERRLEFKRDVPVELLQDGPFQARLLEDAEEDRADLETDGRVLRALGLLEDDVVLYDVLLQFIGEAVVGFYDTETGTLVVRGGSFSPYARSTLAHELTHALDDQWFDLDRPEIEDAEDEAALAFASLVEGNALRVEDAYRASMSDDDREKAEEEEQELGSSIDVDDVPPVIPALVGFPYLAGPRFVAALADAGGEKRVDRAFREPPTTSEDILRPADWLEGQEAVEVPAPAAEGEIIDQGVYGQSTLALTLEPLLGTRDAVRAADGWGGDRYVAWSTGAGAGTCVRATFVMDTPADLDELTRALRDWATEMDDARIQAGPASVTFTACG